MPAWEVVLGDYLTLCSVLQFSGETTLYDYWVVRLCSTQPYQQPGAFFLVTCTSPLGLVVTFSIQSCSMMPVVLPK